MCEGAMTCRAGAGRRRGPLRLYYGKGAGAEPTASAVSSDLVGRDPPAHRRSRAPRAAL
ncbi:hypothetical protein ACU4GD_06900 [Cupriavidus basilensis]